MSYATSLPDENEAARYQVVVDLIPEVDLISDPELRDHVVKIWVETWVASNWESLEEAPKNPHTVKAERSLVDHTRSVTLMSVSLGEIVERLHGLSPNQDWLVAGALLHDVSKLIEFAPAEDRADTSRFGRLVQHPSFAVHKCLEHGLPLDVIHIVGSHTTQSRLPPRTLEAVLVHYADFADSDVLTLEAGGPLLLMAAR